MRRASDRSLVVGAAAMLAGVSRMTISLTVIICEMSNDAGALLPLAESIVSDDGIHPSDYGYCVWGDQIAAALLDIR